MQSMPFVWTQTFPLDIQGARRAFPRHLKMVLTGYSILSIAWAGLFFSENLWELGWLNVANLMICAVSYGLLQKHYVRGAWGLHTFSLVFSTVAMTMNTGWEAGFHYFLLLSYPLALLGNSLLPFSNRSMAVGMIVFYLVLDVIARTQTQTSLTQNSIWFFHYFNMMTFIMSLAVMSMLLWKQVIQSERSFTNMSTEDLQTGLKNRKFMEEVLRREEIRFSRHHQPTSLLICAVDEYDRVNDDYGLEFADRILEGVANTLQRSLRGEDYLGRWNGENFLILLPDTDANGAILVAERIRMRVGNQRMMVAEKLYGPTLSVSIGVLDAAQTMDEVVEKTCSLLHKGMKRRGDQVLVDKISVPESYAYS